MASGLRCSLGFPEGRRQDAAFHSELLGDDVASHEDLARIIERAIGFGVTREQAERPFRGGVGLRQKP